jgi:transposase-like protein
MNKKKCPRCGSPITKRNGTRNGVQLYKCQACGRQFRAGEKVSDEHLWYLYQERKQTIAEIAQDYDVSASTIKRRLRHICVEWEQPDLHGMSGYVHLDATYWGHNWGVLLALDEATTKPLYVAFIKSERTEDYCLAVRKIEENGYHIKGVILDGKISVFHSLPQYPRQMCHFHMKQLIIRKLTKHPKIKASMALLLLINDLPKLTQEQFRKAYEDLQIEYADTIKRRSSAKDGSTHYTHRKLRGALKSVNTFLPYLFKYQRYDCVGMPNTNNKIEGVFTDLSKNLNNHSGLIEENRKRFISGFFLALEGNLHIKNSSKREPTAAEH